MEALREYREDAECWKHYTMQRSMALIDGMLPLRKIVRAGNEIRDMERRVQLMRAEILKHVSVNEYELRRMIALGLLEMKTETPGIMDEITRFYTYCIDHKV